MFELDKKNVKKIILIVAFGVILYWTLQNLETVGNAIGFVIQLIFPFILGLALAFLLNIIVNLIENKILVFKKQGKFMTKIKRPLSITLSVILLLAIMCFILFLVVPELINTFSIFAQNIPTVGENIKQWAQQMTVDYPKISEQIKNINIDWNTVNQNLLKYAQSGVSTILNTSINFIVATISGVVNFVIGFIFAIYILLQKEKLIRQTKKLLYAYLPNKRAHKIIHTASLANKTFNNFMTGQLTEAFILGFLCFIGMLILRIPYALTISVLIGFTALIPLVGAFLGAGIGVILIVVSSPIKAVVFVIFIIVLQQIEGNLIYPKVVGNSVGLSGMWVMVAITIGGSTMGLVGMVICVPIASVIYTVMSERVNIRLRKKQIKIS